MKSSLAEFKEGLDNLKRYIDGLNLEAKLLAASFREDVSSKAHLILLDFQKHNNDYRLVKRRYDYASIIISMYGYWERFIEALVCDYVRLLNTIVPGYDSLPSAITENHLRLSVELMGRLDKTRYSKSIKLEAIISSLNSCINGGGKYKLVEEAFVYHTANFRSDLVDQSFSRLGISSVSQRSTQTCIFSEYLESRLQLEWVSAARPFSYLDDLVERRNEVAHGLPSELLSNELALEYIRFLEILGCALFEVIYSEALAIQVKYKANLLGYPIAVYDNRIVCIKLQGTSVSLGDLLIAKTSSIALPYLGGEIIQIQENKKSMHHASDGATVGLEINFHAKDNQEFYLIST
ncbi:MAG: MAE_28990/MAE_18760 family HEPN-like nuclease [Blastocatellia bacterium]